MPTTNRERATALRSAGWSYAAIGKELGTSRQNVHRMLMLTSAPKVAMTTITVEAELAARITKHAKRHQMTPSEYLGELVEE